MAVSGPNIMNIAAATAKEEFYIIGDKDLYSIIGSKVENKSISIMNEYNSNWFNEVIEKFLSKNLLYDYLWSD